MQALAAGAVVRPRRRIWLDALPFAAMGVVGVVDIVAGPALAFMQLLSLGPALAAVSGTVRRTILIGVTALALTEFLAFYNHIVGSSRNTLALCTVLGVTVAGAIAAGGRQRRERELASVRVVAEVAQRVLLRPVPQVVGPLRMAVRYISATAYARIGGDLYEVVTTPTGVRLIIGDVQGKGLAAVETAATVVGAFREAAHDAVDLAAVAARLEATLSRGADADRTVGAEEFVTGILIEIRPGIDQIEILNCGHPPPLLLGDGTTRLLEPDTEGPPLGLAALAGGSRHPHTVCFPAGHRILLYTDGISEARDRNGDFFPLAERSRLLAGPDLEDALERLHADVLRHVGDTLDDDAAMLLIQRRKSTSPQTRPAPSIEFQH
jgi:serine phosphatase RsbU (regulator of sigma subunit)